MLVLYRERWNIETVVAGSIMVLMYLFLNTSIYLNFALK